MAVVTPRPGAGATRPLRRTPCALRRALRHLGRCGGRPATASDSARACCSPIAASAAPRSCRFPPTGGWPRDARRSTCCRARMRWHALRARASTQASSRRTRSSRNAAAAVGATVMRRHIGDARRPGRAGRGSKLRDVAAQVNDWRILPSGTEGYRTAEVTLRRRGHARPGSRKPCRRAPYPGLYFIGEVVDVTGWLGGYNFQWAWASGHAAGQVV